MKQADTILSHIRSLPQFKLLKSHYCYQKFISLLSPKFQKAIAFVYVRDDTLFVALSHPGFKMELNYNKDLLRGILTILAEQDEKCAYISASKVILFNSKHLSIIKEKPKFNAVSYYEELALGEFVIENKDKELRHAFEKIKKIISNN
jgi:hypothetical protein